MANTPLEFPMGFKILDSAPVDGRYGPYASISAALEALPSGIRFTGLTVNINNVEHWFKTGIADGDLVVKTAPGAGEATLEGVLTNSNDGGGLAIKNIANPTDAQDAATKSFVEGLITALGELVGPWATSGLPTTGSGEGGVIDKGDYWRITATITIAGIGDLKAGDMLIASADNASLAADFFAVQSNVDQATSTVLGLVKLYTDLLAANTDGSVTQAAIKAALDLKAPLASPALTGTPTAPTPAPGTNTTQIATTAFVKGADDLKMNLGSNTSLETLEDASDVYGVSFLSRLGAVFKSNYVRWNETLKQFSVDGTQAIWSAVAGVTNGNMGIKVLEAVSEAFKIFDNLGNFMSVGVDGTKRVVRLFTIVRLYNGVASNEMEFKSVECAESVTTNLKTITLPENSILTVDVSNICVQNADKNTLFGYAQFTFKNDSGVVTDLSQDQLRYGNQYSTIKAVSGFVTNADTRFDASISSTDVSIDFINTEAKLTNAQFEIKYNIAGLPIVE